MLILSTPKPPPRLPTNTFAARQQRSVGARRAFVGTALVLSLGLGLAATTMPTRAADPSPGASDTGTPRGKSRASNARNTRDAPSTESRAERDRRLLRECRGRPNAGACLGYAS